MKFSLLHATYRAGDRAVEVRHRWLAEADEPANVEHIFAADADDEISAACPEIAAGVISPAMEGVSAVRNWNAAAAHATGDVLIVIADDLLPRTGWDSALRLVIRDLDPRVVPFVAKIGDNDRSRDFLIRHPVLSRCYYERHGLWFPGYEGQGVDRDFTLAAHHRGIVLDARAIRFDHLHPSYGAKATESHQRMRLVSSTDPARRLLLSRWPRRKWFVLRRYYHPRAGQVGVSEVERRLRAAFVRLGYVKAAVPDRLKQRLRRVDK